MPKVEYPKWLYKGKPKKNPDDQDETLSLLVKTPEDHAEAAKKGYTEDPDTAHGRDKHHEELPEGAYFGDLPAASGPVAPKVEYPKWLYRRSKAGKLESTLVASYEAHVALKGVWYEEPPSEDDDDAPAALAGTGSGPATVTSVPFANDDELNAPFDPTAMTVEAVKVQVDVMSSIESLEVVAASEKVGANRAGVKQAVSKRIAFLQQKIADDAAAAAAEGAQ